jgi:hypothetical protein
VKPYSRLVFVVIIFVTVVVVCLIFSTEWFRQGYEHQFYSGFLGSILATFFAAFLVWVAWEELSKLSKTSSADFIHRLDNDFFTPETRTLLSLIVYNVLEFCPNDETEEGEPYFKVDPNKLDKKNLPKELMEPLSKRTYYSAFEVDDSLIGLFENVGMLERRGIVSFEMVYDVFSWYLEEAWNNDQINEYIKYERRYESAGQEEAPIDTLIYYHFQYITIKCLEYEGLHCWCSTLWWKFKRNFCKIKPKIERFPSITTPCGT